MNKLTKPWYRPEIDGLRALAIIPVILFHAGITGFSGGFVGVDIFFVISGFLITSIIYRELQNGTFSLVRFWERRVRRIVPALFVVVMTTLIAGYFIILFPVDYIDLGQAALAQAMFLGNLFFMRKNGYFTAPSETMPLLHTWSLSVEEQFYIIFPILMFIIFRWAKKAQLPLLIFLLIASLIYSQSLLIHPGVGFSLPGIPNVWGGALNAGAAFYLLPTRAFELLIGAIIAVGAYTIKNKDIAEVIALFGVGLIGYAIVQFNSETPFPGLLALIPTIGAAALIISNTTHKTFVGSLLSFPLFVWIGLISYSLYLWHWPIFVLAKYKLNKLELSTFETSSLILLSFFLAYLSYRFIETPLRTKIILKGKFTLLAAGFFALLIIIFFGFSIVKKNGLPDRAPEAARAIANATIDFGERRGECFVHSFSKNDDPCLLGEQHESQTDFVVWGDSHAGALLPMIDQEAETNGLTGASFIVEGCTPLIGATQSKIIQKCEHVKELARNYVRENNIPRLMVVARWNGFELLRYTEISIPESLKDSSKAKKSSYQLEETLRQMVTHFSQYGTELYIVKQVPQQLSFSVRKMFQAAAQSPEEATFEAVTYDSYLKHHEAANTIFEKLEEEGIIHVINPANTLCNATSTCIMVQEGTLLYQDGDHLNKTGAHYVAPAFETFFTK